MKSPDSTWCVPIFNLHVSKYTLYQIAVNLSKIHHALAKNTHISLIILQTYSSAHNKSSLKLYYCYIYIYARYVSLKRIFLNNLLLLFSEDNNICLDVSSYVSSYPINNTNRYIFGISEVLSHILQLQYILFCLSFVKKRLPSKLSHPF